MKSREAMILIFNSTVSHKGIADILCMVVIVIGYSPSSDSSVIALVCSDRTSLAVTKSHTSQICSHIWMTCSAWGIRYST